MRTRWMGLGVMLAAAPAAWAHDASAKQGKQAPATATSNAFQQACVDLLNGRLPPGGAKATDALREACTRLMQDRTQAQRDAEERAEASRALAEQSRGQGAAAGTGAGPAQSADGQASAAAEGTGVGAAFAQAGSELVGPRRGTAMGMKRGGKPVGYTLVTNPIGWFDGLGVNAELFGSLLPKVSWVGGARYSRTDATNGSVNTFGIEGGADYFVIGRNNEGLRIGPRLEAAFGRESFQTSTDFGWLGLSGEVGYNFVATNGITGALAAGLGGRIAGDEREDFASFTGGEFGPYAKVGIGYSW